MAKKKPSLVWVICGAGRSVGKTTLAKRLCDLLPGSIYAKHGHGRPSAGKTPNFFRRVDELATFVSEARREASHVVVESNAWAREGKGDLTIFVDAAPGRASTRPDVATLRSAADICVSDKANPKQWRAALAGAAVVASLRPKIVQVLLAHQRFTVGGGVAVRSKVWFEAGGKHIFGAGIADLLATVDQHGTLTAAAKAVNMSYRYAWQLLRTAETHLGRSLVVRQAGGASGGGTALTAEGRHVLEVFRELNCDVAEFADQRFSELYGQRTGNA
jgi:molybdate transport system regulatory protein